MNKYTYGVHDPPPDDWLRTYLMHGDEARGWIVFLFAVMSPIMTLSTQRDYVQPMFLLIAFVVVVFCFFSTVNTFTLGCVRKSVHNYCMRYSRSCRHFSRMFFSSFPACPFTCSPSRFRLSIPSHAGSVLFSNVWSPVSDLLSLANALFTLACKPIRDGSMLSKCREHFPFSTSGTNLSLHSVYGTMFGSHFLSKLKALRDAAFVSSKRVPKGDDSIICSFSFARQE